jgi:hypothetical protein
LNFGPVKKLVTHRSTPGAYPVESKAGSVEKSYNRHREDSRRRTVRPSPFVDHSLTMSTKLREIASNSPKIGFARCKLSSIDVVAIQRSTPQTGARAVVAKNLLNV